LLYSHDSVGLGHLRRSLTLASSLAETMPGASMLLATGSDAALRFELPEGLEVVKLPSVGKSEDGSYCSRRLPGGLPSLVRIRRAILMQLVETHRPDLLIVDHKVLGVAEELEPVLARMKEIGGLSILGVRDVIDEPAVVAREWGSAKIRHALIESYDAVCVYGSEQVYDLRQECPMPPELAKRLQYTGFVVRPMNGLAYPPLPRLKDLVLVTTGGGEDGAERIESYLDMIEQSRPQWESMIVFGPLLDAVRRRQLKRRARVLEGVSVHSFYEDLPRLLADSSAVVAMAGYNTVVEIMRSRVPALLLPRTTPRKEQLIRARRVAELGFAECLVEPTVDRMRMAVESCLSRGRFQGPMPSLDGASAFSDVVCQMLGREAVRSGGETI
jgi:predicted glycosyltransferase